MLAVAYIWMAIFMLPPFFGLGAWAMNTKWHACVFTAYDFGSYIYGNVLLCGLTGVPIISLNTFCYWSIGKKVCMT